MATLIKSDLARVLNRRSSLGSRLAVATCKKLKHQKHHQSIEFIGNNHKQSFVEKPRYFVKLKKSVQTEFLTEKEDMSGKNRTYGNPN